MKTFKILLIIAVIISSSCKERMEIELDGTYTRLIVDGLITTDDSIQKVKLTKSANYFNNLPAEPILNASVTISVDDSSIVLTDKQNKGIYETAASFKGIPGKTYKLTIRNIDIGNGVHEYWASTYMPKYSKIDTFFITALKEKDFAPPGSKYIVNLTLTDPEQTQDNYLFRIYKNGRQLTDTLNRLSFRNDSRFNGKQLYPSLLYYVRYDYSIGRGSGIVVTTDSIKKNDQLVLEVDGITKEYITFLSQMQTQYRNTNPLFSGPRANVTTNIYPLDKAVGFFTAYIIDRDTLTVK
jgi:hypothetical protein